MKITSAMVDEVERMLAEGLVSQRKIAKLVGISRGTVNGIALGRRPRIADPPPSADSYEPQRGPLVRCPGCGGKVYLPCLLCHVRKLKARDDGLHGCPHAGVLAQRDHIQGADARTCRQPGNRQPVEPTNQPQPHSQWLGRPRVIAASPTALAPALGAISFTPAADSVINVDLVARTAGAISPESSSDC